MNAKSFKGRSKVDIKIGLDKIRGHDSHVNHMDDIYVPDVTTKYVGLMNVTPRNKQTAEGAMLTVF